LAEEGTVERDAAAIERKTIGGDRVRMLLEVVFDVEWVLFEEIAEFS